MGKFLRIWKLSKLFLFIFWSISVNASPYPAQGSSALMNPENGLFYLAQGFHLSNPEKIVSVSSDELKNQMSLEDYAKKWMKDYSAYGFDLLGSRPFKENDVRGIVVDLYHRKSQTQMRQSIFLHDQKVVILTCVDEKSHFDKILNDCNQVIRSFNWVK